MPDHDDPVGQRRRARRRGAAAGGRTPRCPRPRAAAGWPRTRTGRARSHSTASAGSVDLEDTGEVGDGSAASRGGRERRAPPTPKSRRTGDRRRTTSAPAHPTDSLTSRGTNRAAQQRSTRPTGWPAADPLERAMADLTEASARRWNRHAVALCIIAGAGSGKTRVLTLRAARRIRDGSADADHTLICTFTRKAARRAPAATPPLRRGRVHPGDSRRRPEPRGPGRHPPPAGADPAPAARPRRRSAHLRWWPSTGTGRSSASSAIRPWPRPVDTEIGWAKANCLTAGSYADRGLGGRPVGRSFPSTRWPMPSTPTRTSLAAPAGARPRRRPAPIRRPAARRRRLRRTHAVAVPAPVGRRVPGREPGAVPAHPGPGRDQARPVRGGRSEPGHLRMERGRSPACSAASPSSSPGWRWSGSIANHRSSPQVVAAAAAALGPSAAVPPRSTAPDGPLPVVTAYDDDDGRGRGRGRRPAPVGQPRA